MNQAEATLPVQQLQPNPWNRKTFDAQGLQELSENLKTKGIIEPLIVRKVGESQYQIASGERRWRAALQAGINEAPCRVLELTDEDVQDMNLIANIQREDIPALEKAAMVKARMVAGLTQAQIAQKLGKSQKWVCDLLSLSDLPKEVQAHLTGLPLGLRHVQAIASLPTPAYQEQLAQEIKNGDVPLEDVHKRAHHLSTGFKSSQAKRAKKADSHNGGFARQPIRTYGRFANSRFANSG